MVLLEFFCESAFEVCFGNNLAVFENLFGSFERLFDKIFG